MSRLLGLAITLALMTACSFGHQEGGELDPNTTKPGATTSDNSAGICVLGL